MLLDYLEASSYHILNDGTPTRGQAVLDLTVADLATVGCITKWKVMASPGLTDHNTITFHFDSLRQHRKKVHHPVGGLVPLLRLGSALKP